MSVNNASVSYWETRYKKGGTSGSGSIGKLRDWKWSVIQQFVGEIQSVIDVGCGDLSFWAGKPLPKFYLGIDFSETIIKKNREQWSENRFVCSSADKYVEETPKAHTVFCLDVLFHIMDDSVYVNVISNLTKYAEKWIFVYTWRTNPFDNLKLRLNSAALSVSHGRLLDALKRMEDKTSDGLYEKYRDFKMFEPLFEKAGFALISQEQESTNKFGSMYVFKSNDR